MRCCAEARETERNGWRKCSLVRSPVCGDRICKETAIEKPPRTLDLDHAERRRLGNLGNSGAIGSIEDSAPENRHIQNLSAVGKLALRSEEHTSELQSLRHLVCRL